MSKRKRVINIDKAREELDLPKKVRTTLAQIKLYVKDIEKHLGEDPSDVIDSSYVLDRYRMIQTAIRLDNYALTASLFLDLAEEGYE